MKNVIRNMPAIIALDLDQHVPGIEHSRRLDALIAAHFDYRLGGHQNFDNLALQIGITNPRLKTVADFLLVPRVSM
jgi:hypothetical protein